MAIVEQSLAAWATSASDEQLDLGPSLDDLGGYDAVLAEATMLAIGPQLPYLLTSLAHSIQSLTHRQAEDLAAAIVPGLRQPHASWVLSESIDIMLQQPAVLGLLSPEIGAALMDLATGALCGRVETDLAYPAVSGLLQLAVVGQYNRYSLLALLTGITGSEPLDALARLPLLVGVAHDQFGADELLATLNRLEELDDLSPSARLDSSFELAVGTLRAALNARDSDEVVRLVRDATMRLRTVVDRQEGRLDAEAYAYALEAVLVFADAGSVLDQHRESRLCELAANLSKVVAKRNAWSSRMAQPAWLEARGHAEAAWAQLASILATAAAHMNEPSWLNATSVLKSVLDVYRAARAVHATTVDDTGHSVEAIISPAVEASFIRQAGLLHHLRRAIEDGADFTDHPDAQRVARAIDERLANAAFNGRDAPGKDTAGGARLASLGVSDQNIDDSLLGLINRTIADYERGYALSGNIQMDNQLAKLYELLSRSSAWQQPASQHFFNLVDQLLRFLHSRFDAQADLLGTRTAYLGPPAGGTNWLEKNVQDDFYEHLTGVFPPGTVFRELIDVASGRTDIVYLPEPGMRFVVEVKRELSKCDPESVERKYLSQAANYTATGPPFGILLVGDHTDHRSGYSSLDDRVWIAQRSRTATETPRLIVVATLPIGRSTPSDLRAPSPVTRHPAPSWPS